MCSTAWTPPPGVPATPEHARARRDRRTGFWGRGVATAWTLTVSQAIIQAAGVDLSALTKVSAGLKYTTRAKHI
ncbi:hypothetical protein [Sphaerisporangium rhizosphaerae]|uniref:Uncharacterized protein n=1 Tax=Sphaerisporangium rhizosphaerae TaxID=2269375 RepID=A0ABW2P9D6_9ACTN